MKCPACSNELSTVQSGEIVFDVCKNYCGGVWLDRGELEKVDDQSEAVSQEILQPLSYQNVVVDRSKDRFCPKCVGQVLHRHIIDSDQQLEIEECLSCGGVWLDLGELRVIRSEHEKEDRSERVIKEWAQKHISKDGKSFPRSVAAVFRILF